MRGRDLGLALLLAATAGAARSTAATAEACTGGGGASLYGDVIVSSFAPNTVQLTWSAWEDPALRSYTVTRYPAGCLEARCATKVARLKARAGDGSLQEYSLTDGPPAGTWTYRLEALLGHGQRCVAEATVVVAAPPPCDAAALCSQIEASFYGTVIVGGATPTIEVRWLTHAESGAVSGYKLSRSDCGARGRCRVELATVSATGSCGEVKLHAVTDTPPAARSTYELEVLSADGRKLCAVRAAAPASPASSR